MGPFSLIKTEANRKLAQENASRFGYFRLSDIGDEVAIMTATVVLIPKPIIDVVLVTRQEIENGMNTYALMGVRLKVKKTWLTRMKYENVVFTDNTSGFVNNVVELLNITGLCVGTSVVVLESALKY